MKDTFSTPDLERSIKALRCITNGVTLEVIIELQQHESLNLKAIDMIMKPKGILPTSHITKLVKYGVVIREWKDSTWYFRVNRPLIESMKTYVSEIKLVPYVV